MIGIFTRFNITAVNPASGMNTSIASIIISSYAILLRGSGFPPKTVDERAGRNSGCVSHHDHARYGEHAIRAGFPVRSDKSLPALARGLSAFIRIMLRKQYAGKLLFRNIAVYAAEHITDFFDVKPFLQRDFRVVIGTERAAVDFPSRRA